MQGLGAPGPHGGYVGQALQQLRRKTGQHWQVRSLLGSVPDSTVVLDLPLPAGYWWIVGRMSVPYITRINRVIREVAADRNLPVAEASAHFTPPWVGKFSCDNFHPSQDGYRDWTRALLAAIPATPRTPEPPNTA